MKLFNPPFTKRTLSALGVAVLAGVGVANAQYTGIGTTAPDATLHVKFPQIGGVQQDTTLQPGWNSLIVEDLRSTSSDPTFGSLMAINPSTGIVRYRKVDDIIKNSAEWVYNGSTIEPRRFTNAMDIDGSSVLIGVATTINGNTAITGTFGVTGNSTLTGTLDVTQATNLQNTLDIGVATALGSSLSGDDEILIRDAGGTLVQHVTVDDLLTESSYWVKTGTGTSTVYTPRDIESAISVGQTAISIGTSTTNANLTVTGNASVSGTSLLSGKVTLGDVDQAAAPAPEDATKVLIQSASGVIEYVTVEDLVQNNAEWIDGGTGNPWIYAVQANDGGNDVVVSDNGRIGVGTTAPGQAIEVVGGNIAIDADQALQIGTSSLAGNGGGNVTLTTTGTYTEAVSGAYTQSAASGSITSTGNYSIATTAASSTITQQATASGTVVTVNNLGLHIGGVTTNARELYVEGNSGSDDVQFGNTTPVSDVSTTGTSGAAPDVFERVLITDHQGVVRYIDAADLVSSASEWVFSDNGTPSDVTDDYIYARRARATSAANDVRVTHNGDLLMSDSKEIQWGASDNIAVTAGTSFDITSSGAFNMTAADGATFATGDANDVSFTENGNVWMHYDADAGGTTEQGRVGINTNSPAATLHVAGNIVASNSTVTSDRRFKRDIKDFEGALDAVQALRGVSYAFRTDEFPAENFDKAEHLGFIAQEIRDVLPQTVIERGDGYLTVDYAAVTPVLVEAIKELNGKVEALQAENATLRGTASASVGAVSTKQLLELEARITEMSARLEEVAGRK